MSDYLYMYICHLLPGPMVTCLVKFDMAYFVLCDTLCDNNEWFVDGKINLYHGTLAVVISTFNT